MLIEFSFTNFRSFKEMTTLRMIAARICLNDTILNKFLKIYDLDYKGDQVGQKEDFNNSITKAKSKGMKVAYCDDTFEL